MVFNLILFLIVILYAYLRLEAVSHVVFNPHFAGNDARQQLFPFYSVLYPGVFENDLTYAAMKAYIAPIHLWLGNSITFFTQSPIMTGHSIMVLQLILVSLFTFLTVKKLASVTAGILSVLWIFHTSDLFMNTIGGLSRSWAGVVVSFYLLFLVRDRYKLCIVAIMIGCLLHPPSAFVIAFCHGTYLLWRVISKQSRAQYSRVFLVFIACCPLILGITYFSVKRPAEIGKMANFEEASKNEAFSRNGGRFPFIPLDNAYSEFKRTGLITFSHKKTPLDNKIITPDMIAATLLGLFTLILFLQLRYSYNILPLHLWFYLISVISSYFLSRLFIFNLYVPARYLAWPLSIFFIVAITSILWRIPSALSFSANKQKVFRVVAYCLLIAFIFICSGTGIHSNERALNSYQRNANFFKWIREKTPIFSQVAGHPSQLDGVQLYSIRRAFVTTETTHPFYDQYFKEMSRRLDISFKALYARNIENFFEALGNESIDYFVFGHQYFLPSKKAGKPGLKNNSYFLPQKILVQDLTRSAPSEYLYSKILELQRTAPLPFIVYNDSNVMIVEISGMKSYFEKNANH